LGTGENNNWKKEKNPAILNREENQKNEEKQ
jgi:hypothetical protein